MRASLGWMIMKGGDVKNKLMEDTVDMIPAQVLELLQQHLENGDYIDYDKFCRKGISRKLALWNPSGELIVSGKNIKELLNNLMQKGGGK